jgi:hypothetical protein
VLIVAAATIALTHMLEHLGRLHVLPSTGMQDHLLGYPMAAILAIAALVVLTVSLSAPLMVVSIRGGVDRGPRRIRPGCPIVL